MDVVVVGRVVRAHGVHGGLVVGPLTDRADRFEPGRRLLLGPDREPVTIASTRPYKGRLLLTFAEIRDRDRAEAVRRADLAIPADEAGPPPPGEVWAWDIEGLPIVDDTGAVLGEVVAVEANPAHDLLVGRDPAGNEFYVPMVGALMDPLLPGADRVVVRPIPGLLPGGDSAT